MAVPSGVMHFPISPGRARGTTRGGSGPRAPVAAERPATGRGRYFPPACVPGPMNGPGTVEAIHIAPAAGEPMDAVDAVEAVDGRGLSGDRYFSEAGTFSGVEGTGRDLTLVEAEAIEAIEREADIALGPGEHRRNVTTRGVALNHLVGERFRVGEVVCAGRRLCEPCSHLESLTGEAVIDALLHRGGLRADVVSGGTIAVGDDVTAP